MFFIKLCIIGCWSQQHLQQYRSVVFPRKLLVIILLYKRRIILAKNISKMCFRLFTRLQSLWWNTANFVSRAMNTKHPTERHLLLFCYCLFPLPSLWPAHLPFLQSHHQLGTLQTNLRFLCLYFMLTWSQHGSYSNVSVAVPKAKRFASGREIKFHVFSVNSGKPWSSKLREAPKLCPYVWKSQ